jgi:hypothetical protein
MKPWMTRFQVSPPRVATPIAKPGRTLHERLRSLDGRISEPGMVRLSRRYLITAQSENGVSAPLQTTVGMKIWPNKQLDVYWWNG